MSDWLALSVTIANLQEGVGGGVSVTLGLRDGALVVRFTWPDAVWVYEYVLVETVVRSDFISTVHLVDCARHSFDTRVIKK